MVLTLRDILAFDVLDEAAPEVLTGQDGLDRPVRWVHSSEIYEIGPLLCGSELLLTTGLGLAGADAGARRHYVRDLAERGVAGVAVEVGRSLPDVPYEIVDESRRRDLPLVALRRVVPFIRITEAANTAIVTQAMAEQRRQPADREGRSAALLAGLEEGTALSQGEVAARARAVGFRPEPSHRLVGVAVLAHPSEEQGLAVAVAVVDRAARELGGPVLRAGRAGAVTGLFAVPTGCPRDPVRTVQEAVRAAADGLGAAGLTAALGHAVPGGAAWTRWGESLREARSALRLALAVPPPGTPAGSAPAGALVTSSRALALERELVGDGLTAESRDRLARLVGRTLGPLLEWEASHPSDLVRTLEVHLRNGCSPTRTAALLHVGRQSLYQRLERIESLLGAPVGDPELHAELLLATCARRVLHTAT
ncbi:PucR family transcriptional regulator [Streptomyces sp. RB6PN25]|uniref:PucR family transcriptional regulator n=1 Tax=Streptomyces humicola TaxID=2953240 RepID=A0ABT1Q0W1_9ACTN|nr:PucR family transcriptional regulator [Streptomyces humicola]MCQ4082387.1 PucR family transcriptional regulator [Streptomyces humicola]